MHIAVARGTGTENTAAAGAVWYIREASGYPILLLVGRLDPWSLTISKFLNFHLSRHGPQTHHKNPEKQFRGPFDFSSISLIKSSIRFQQVKQVQKIQKFCRNRNSANFTKKPTMYSSV